MPSPIVLNGVPTDADLTSKHIEEPTVGRLGKWHVDVTVPKDVATQAAIDMSGPASPQKIVIRFPHEDAHREGEASVMGAEETTDTQFVKVRLRGIGPLAYVQE